MMRALLSTVALGGLVLATARPARAQTFGVDDTGRAVFAYMAQSTGHVHARWLTAGGVFSPAYRLSPTGENYNPAIAVDAQGDATTCWQSLAGGGASPSVLARRSPAAAPQSSSLVTMEAAALRPSAPAAAANATGTAACVWTEDDASSGLRRVYAYVFAPGAVSGVRRRVSPSGSSEPSEFEYEVAVAADGTVTVAWVTDTGDVFARRIHPDGTLGSSHAVAGLGDSLFRHTLRLAVDAAGTATILWVQPDRVLGTWRVYARRLTAAGALSGIKALSSAQTNAWIPALAIDPSGHAAIAYGTYSPVDPFAPGPVKFVRWMADDSLSGTIVVADAVADTMLQPWVEAGPDGDLTFLFSHRPRSTSTPGALRTRRLYAGGTLGPMVQVGTGEGLGVRVNAAGDATFAWRAFAATLKTVQLDAADNLGPVRNVAYVDH